MSKIKTRETKKDIKIFDRAASVGTRIKNASIKSKQAMESADKGADETQDAGYNTPSEYASDQITDGTKDIGERAVRGLKKNPIKRASANVNKAKENMQEAKRQVSNIKDAVRKPANNQPKKEMVRRAQKSTQRTASRTKQSVEKTIKTVQKSDKTIKTASKTVKGSAKAAKKGIKTAERSAKVTVKTTKQAAKTAQRTAQAAAKAAKIAVQAAKAATKAAAQAAKIAAKVLIATVKAIIAAIKALVAAIAAGGWIVVVIILIIVLIAVLLASPFSIFMGDEAPDSGTSSIGMPVAVGLSQSVLQYKPIVERECNANGIPEYVDTILAIMMQESGGNLPDVMQSSESMGLSPNSLEPEPSIVQGVQYFKGLLNQGATANVDFHAMLQAYNYGGGYIGYVMRNGGAHTQELADSFSDEQAARLGWSNYGDKLYVPHVTRYLEGVGDVVATDTPVGRHLNSLYAELSHKIGAESAKLDGTDASEVVYDNGEADSKYNPVEVMAIYSVKATLAADEPVTLAMFEQEQADELTAVFWDMYSIHTEVVSRTVTIEDEEGNEQQQMQRVKIVHVAIKSAEEMKQTYGFSREQSDVLNDMLTNPYRSMLLSMLGSDIGGDLTSGQLENLFNNLPEGENGAKIVRLALSRLGDPYSQPLAGQGNHTDCSYLSQWCHKQIGIDIPRTAAAQGQFCVDNGLTIRQEDLRPGDLVFFSHNRNGRFMNITHVAIYAGEGMIVDASSSRGEVVYRELFSGHVLYARAYAQ